MDEIILPTPAPPFVWRRTVWGPALICRSIEPWANHLFTTRHWALGTRSLRAPFDGPGSPATRGEAPRPTRPPSAAAGREVPGGWADIAEAIGVSDQCLIRARQVHGCAVWAADLHEEPSPGADILITRDAEQAVAVRAADCAPLLIVDPQKQAVAAVHAGWRGMAARAPVAAVRALARTYGSRPSDLLVAVGPSIGACCYEVGNDVRAAFAAAGFTSDELRRWFLDRPVISSGNPPSRGDAPRRPDRWFFDGWTAVRGQLHAAGVPPAQVFLAGLCTASHAGSFCSYRRDGSAAGRMAGAIRLLPPRPSPR